MRITRTRLTEIIREELEGLLEAEPEPGKRKRKPDVAAADVEPTEPNREAPAGGTVRSDDASPVPPGKVPGQRLDPSELDQPKDGPAGPPEGEEGEPDAEIAPEDDPEAVDATGDAGEEPSGAVNTELSGKTVQAITIEPKSKVLPGAKEVVLAFNDTTDALRILVTATGMVKFFWRGQLHDLP